MEKRKTYQIIGVISSVVSAILLLLFAFFVGMDLGGYNPAHTSAPFSVYILIRGLEFLLPSIITAGIALFLLKRNKK